MTEELYIIPIAPSGKLSIVKGVDIRNEFPKNIHTSYIFGVIDNGDQEFNIKGSCYYLDENDAFILNTGEPHHFKHATSNSFSYTILSIDKDWMRSLTEQKTSMWRGYPVFRNIICRDMQLFEMMQDVVKGIENADSQSEKKEQLFNFFDYVFDSYAVGLMEKKVSHDAVKKVRHHIDRNYKEDLSLNMLADIAKASPYHLNRIFSKSVGLTLHNYLLQVKIKYARVLLLQNQSIADVAHELNFTDQSHFTRIFKKIVGITPGRFIRLNCG